MFLIRKAIAAFILPPGIFIVILMFAAVWFFLRRKVAPGLVTFLIALVMWGASITPVSDALMRGLEHDFSIPRDPKGDVIVLLGGGVYGKVPDMTGTGAPSEEMYGRIVTAVRLQKKLDVPIIVSGGKVFEHKEAEAPIVRRFLLDLGVAPQKIIVEERSRDTFENAQYTKELCRELRLKRPVVVTSAYHLKRAVLSFRKAGMEVTPFPASFKSAQGKQYDWTDYLPGDYRRVAAAVHEYLGIAFYTTIY